MRTIKTVSDIPVYIRYILKEEGYSNKDVQLKTGLSRSRISHILNDNQAFGNIQSLTNFLNAIGYELIIQKKG